MGTWSLRLKLILSFTFGAASSVALGTHGIASQNVILQTSQTLSQRVLMASNDLRTSFGELQELINEQSQMIMGTVSPLHPAPTNEKNFKPELELPQKRVA